MLSDVSILIVGGPYLNFNPTLQFNHDNLFLSYGLSLKDAWSKMDTQKANVIVNDDTNLPKIDNDNNRYLNNQIQNTRCGLDSIKTKYTLRVRADLVISDVQKIIKTYAELSQLKRKNPVFDGYIMTSSFFTCNPYGPSPLSMHPGDWLNFGLTSDLKKLYDIEYINPQEVLTADKKQKYRCEQYICVKGLKNFGYSIINWGDDHSDLKEATLNLFKNNFLIFDTNYGSCVHNIKYPYATNSPMVLGMKDWLKIKGVLK